ncbi:hypothetical protein [Paraburkholderia bannensis]|nr:hypothetical protein [Paraburkholderia bannensis]
MPPSACELYAAKKPPGITAKAAFFMAARIERDGHQNFRALCA